MKNPAIDIAIKNDTAEIDPLAEQVLAFCRQRNVGDDFFYDVRLALEEAVSNTIKFGYDDHGVHTIRVKASLNDQELHLEIEDDAKDFNPMDVPAPDLALPVEERPIGGLGVFLLRAVMDHSEHERIGDRNSLRMTKRLR